MNVRRTADCLRWRGVNRGRERITIKKKKIVGRKSWTGKRRGALLTSDGQLSCSLTLCGLASFMLLSERISLLLFVVFWCWESKMFLGCFLAPQSGTTMLMLFLICDSQWTVRKNWISHFCPHWCFEWRLRCRSCVSQCCCIDYLLWFIKFVILFEM